MKKLAIALVIMLTLGDVTHAQFTYQAQWVEDTISLLQNYTQDIYYNMNNGVVKTDSARNYHLAFSMSPVVDRAAIWANHQSGNQFTKVYNVHKTISQFSTVVLGDTATAALQYNNDKGWFNGAFNFSSNPDPFHFGWGTYDIGTHFVNGDSVFIVRAGSGPGTAFYKLALDSLNGYTNTYYFRVENLSTPGAATSYTIDTVGFSNKNFAFFNLTTGTKVNREPAKNSWDLLFTRYTTDAPGSGQGVNNNVIGALLNKKVLAAKAFSVLPDSAWDKYQNYVLDSALATIGYNWKTFVGPEWIIPDSTSYFVKDKNAALWQLEFLAFGGQPNGDIVFRSRPVWPTSVQQINSTIQQIAIVPNPANYQFNLVLDSKKHGNALLMVQDVMGRIVFHSNRILKEGVNAFSLNSSPWNSGQYFISVYSNGLKTTEKIIIAH